MSSKSQNLESLEISTSVFLLLIHIYVSHKQRLKKQNYFYTLSASLTKYMCKCVYIVVCVYICYIKNSHHAYMRRNNFAKYYIFQNRNLKI